MLGIIRIQKASVTLVLTLLLEFDEAYLLANFVVYRFFFNYFESSFLATHLLKSSDDLPLYSVVRIIFLFVPRVLFYFFEGDPVIPVESEELENKILESGRKVLTLDGFPVLVKISTYDHLEVWVC